MLMVLDPSHKQSFLCHKSWLVPRVQLLSCLVFPLIPGPFCQPSLCWSVSAVCETWFRSSLHSCCPLYWLSQLARRACLERIQKTNFLKRHCCCWACSDLVLQRELPRESSSITLSLNCRLQWCILKHTFAESAGNHNLRIQDLNNYTTAVLMLLSLTQSSSFLFIGCMSQLKLYFKF